ncbi:hypothetical protein LOC67_23010 [Stieleria sp. JC731]|uniref:hypothetical protein n=1 Tax=Pirellulaceae TaxID=2691357 RepID=UPI001E34E718|nr:hypothetical protein [Stieleria sp. JC731]MCC9603429.1 hypothetical protein [Stieleria sp. JC731]
MSKPYAETSARSKWQGETTGRSHRLSALRRWAARCFWPLLITTSICGFTGLVWLLTLVPKRTPILVFAAAPYQWPLPPVEWEAEDLQRLESLDRQTISMNGNDVDVHGANDFLERLSAAVEHANGQWIDQPLIVWVNLHGISSGDQAYLIPPNASPVDPTTWIDFREILRVFDSSSLQRETLLVLDCNHMQVNWHAGLKANRFVERAGSLIRQAFDKQQIGSNVAFLFSSQDNEHSRHSASLRGSVFGHFFHQAIAGASDRSGDGWVSLTELDQYVKKNVNEWVSFNRASSQSPSLLRHDDTVDFQLVRSMRNTGGQQLTAADVQQPAAPTISDTEMKTLWKSLDALREMAVFQFEPIAFRDLEHRLLWLEQLSVAGAGYQKLANSVAEQLKNDFAAIDKRIANQNSHRDLFFAASRLSGKPAKLPDSASVHSFAVANFLGSESNTVADELAGQLRSFSAQPDVGHLKTAAETFRDSASDIYTEEQLFRMLARYQTPELWDHAASIGRLIQTRNAIDQVWLATGSNNLPRPHWFAVRNTAQLGAIDQLRREIEDDTFSIMPEALETRLDRLDSMLRQQHAEIDQRGNVQKDCDSRAAALPYLAMWRTSPLRHARFAETDQQALNDLVSLIKSNRLLSIELGRQLEGPVSTASDSLSRDFAAQLEQTHQEIRAAIQQSELSDASVVDRIEALLLMPTIDAIQRSELKQTSRQLAAGLAAAMLANQSQAINSDSGQPQSDNYAEQISQWESHPLDVLLDNDESTPLIGPELITSYVESIDKASANATGLKTLEERRDAFVILSSKMRASSAIATPKFATDPLQRLLQNDVQQLLVQQAERSLRDLWGNAGSGEMFCDTAVSNYCDAVEIIEQAWTPISASPIPTSEKNASATFPAITRLRQSLTARLANANEWLTTSSNAAIQIEDSAKIRADLSVATNLAKTEDPSFPDGTAVIKCFQGATAFDPIEIEPSDSRAVGSANESFSLSIASDDVIKSTGFQVAAVFRGHEFRQDLDVKRLGGVTITTQPQPSTISDITLNANSAGLSVGFILDGSASMDEPLQGESKRRIDIAKDALQAMLMELAQRGDSRASVRAFGHRAGWSTTEPLRIMTRPDLIDLSPAQVVPARDVETLYELSHLNVIAAQKTAAEIAAVQPWGQSPLYLAVADSLGEFPSNRTADNRHIVVITDGENYQFAPPSDGQFRPTTDQDIRQQWQRSQIPIHILGLGMDRTDDAGAIAEFEQLCRDTGGQFHALQSSTDLKQTLASLLRVRSYEVVNESSQLAPVTRTSVGKSVRLQLPSGKTQRFGLHLEGDFTHPPVSEQMQLEGGESIQLFVDTQGTEIFAFPFDQDVVASQRLVTSDNSDSSMLLRLHQAKRQQSTVTIQASVQELSSTATNRFKPTDKPQSYWIEVQPLAKSTSDNSFVESGQRYVFNDRSFENKTPVPVISLIAENWPAAATHASVNVWIGDQDSATVEILPAPSDALTLAAPETKIVRENPRGGISQTIAFQANSKLIAEMAKPIPLEMEAFTPNETEDSVAHRFILRFKEASEDVDTIKIAPQSKGIVPDRIVRQYDTVAGVAVHTFYYATKPSNLNGINYQITDRVFEIENAKRLPSQTHPSPGLQIVIPPENGLIPVGTAFRRQTTGQGHSLR